MSIKEASQKGNYVYVKNDRQSGTQIPGTLIGYTSKVVFYTSGNFVKIYTDDGHGFKPVGTHIALNGGEAVMCGNCVGIKKNGRILLYHENGKSAGSRNA